MRCVFLRCVSCTRGIPVHWLLTCKDTAPPPTHYHLGLAVQGLGCWGGNPTLPSQHPHPQNLNHEPARRPGGGPDSQELVRHHPNIRLHRRNIQYTSHLTQHHHHAPRHLARPSGLGPEKFSYDRGTPVPRCRVSGVGLRVRGSEFL